MISKRTAIKNIDYALVAKTHSPMYMMHKYWARKPHNVVSEYIKHYSKEGDIVLDPFCGSGPTPIEAIKLGRKGIGIDLDPIATFITRMTAMPVDSSKIKMSFEEVKDKCKKEIEKLYKTRCKKCGKSGVINITHFENDMPIKILYDCDACGKQDKKPDDEDIGLLKKIEKIDVPYWHPKNRLYYDGNSFLKKEKSETIVDLFSKRNLIGLSILLHHIKNNAKPEIKDVFLFTFSSGLHLCSKMLPLSKEHGTWSGWTLHSFWVPPLRIERNVWNVFKERFEAFLKGKEDSNTLIKYYKEAKRFYDLNDGANIFLKTHNTLELTDIIPKNSIDYVFTDPPYGGAVQYFELSSIFNSWLQTEENYRDEITINKNQSKDFDYYHKMLRKSFKEIYHVLKPGKYMTVTFHSTDIKVWNSIIKAVIMVGFELKKIIYQPPAMPSAKSYYQPYGSAVGDYYIRFRKPETEVLETEKEIDLKTYEMEVVDIAQGIIGERGEPTIYQHILNGIMAELQGGRRVPVGAKNIEDVLKEHVGKEFELIPIKDEKDRTLGKKWWLKGADISHFSQPTLTDRIERKVVEVLEHNVKVSFDEILQAIFIEFPNALTPEAEKIRDVLKEYATTSDGKWQLKPDLRLNLTESVHSKMIYMLALLGEKAGFDVWIGKNEQSQTYSNTKLETLVNIKKPMWRFVNTMDWDRVSQIDTIWHDRGRIAFEFEVENTTAITEAISRGSNIPHNNLKRIIVIPKEREKFLHRKMKDPMINENIVKYDWQFIFYQDLENFFNKKSKRISLSEFEKLFRMPKEARQTQNILNDYPQNSDVHR